MTVAELIAKLQTMDQTLPVYTLAYPTAQDSCCEEEEVSVVERRANDLHGDVVMITAKGC